MRKSLLTFLGEALDQYRAQQHATDTLVATAKKGGRRLPGPGSLVPTILVVAALLFANRAGALAFLGPAAPATSATTIPYQGRLANASGQPITDMKPMTFRLWDVGSGGTPLWTEAWSGPNSVRVSDGLFNVMLGSVTPIPASVVASNATLWLGITVGADSEMAPRVQLGTVPYAMQALSVPDDSISAAKLTDGSVTTGKLVDGSVSAAKLTDGSVTNGKLADGSVSAPKILNGSVSTDKLADSVVTARKTKTASYVQSANQETVLSAFDSWVPLAPLNITIPASDLPVTTKALVMFQARCSANVGMAITFYLDVDGSVMQYTDAFPTANQMLIFPMNDVVTLSANAPHTISIKWRMVLATSGNAKCHDRRLQVILLGQ